MKATDSHSHLVRGEGEGPCSQATLPFSRTIAACGFAASSGQRAAKRQAVPPFQRAAFRWIARTFLAAAVCAVVVVGAANPPAPSAPPATQPSAILLPPLQTSPEPSTPPTLLPVPFRSYLDPATVNHDPRILPEDTFLPMRAEPALDIPPLAFGGLSLPAEAALAVGPTIHIDSTALELPVATIAARPDLATATLTTDPTAGLATDGALVLFPPPRTTEPPPLLLSIPDPTHQIGYLAANEPPGEDPPAMDFNRPGPTTLPVRP